MFITKKMSSSDDQRSLANLMLGVFGALTVILLLVWLARGHGNCDPTGTEKTLAFTCICREGFSGAACETPPQQN